MTSVYNQETATAMYLREQRDIAMKEGLAKGIEQGIERGIEKGIEQGIEKGIAVGREEGEKEGLFQGKLDLLIEMVKEKIISIADAAKRIGLSEREFLKYIK